MNSVLWVLGTLCLGKEEIDNGQCDSWGYIPPLPERKSTDKELVVIN